MTDQELIDLVGRKAPDELSLDEIEALRRGLGRSAALREALVDRLHLEQYLGDALGRIEISIDEILRRADRPNTGVPIARWLGWAFAWLVALTLAVVLWMVVTGSRDDPHHLLAARRGPDRPGPDEAGRANRTEDKSGGRQRSGTQARSPDRRIKPSGVAETEGKGAGRLIRSAPGGGEAAGAVRQRKGDAEAEQPPRESPVEPGEPGRDKAAEPKTEQPRQPAPWDAVLAAADPPPPFEAVAFADFTPDRLLGPGNLGDWVEAVDKEPLKLHEKPGTAPVVEGIARLRSPWREDLALRVALEDHHGFKMHFWRGEQGVTLWYYAYPPAWAAYTTTRKPSDPRPADYALAATDNHRYGRTGAGTVELRQLGERLVLTRGDVLLVSVPFAAPPEEVFLEGRATVKGLELVRSAELPAALLADPRAPGPVVLRSLAPNRLAWKSELPAGAELNKHADGVLELAAGKTAAAARASVPLAEPGLCEAIFEIESPAPGTGLFLADRLGRPLYQVAFFRDPRNGAVTFGFLPAGQQRVESNEDPAKQPTPFAAERLWLRLVLGAGALKCWVSPDGKQWSQALAPLHRPEGLPPYARLGLYCLPGEEARSIRLRRLEVRQLGLFASLGSRELHEQALALPLEGAPDLESWSQTVAANPPPESDAPAWRRACALRTLAAGPPENLAHALLLDLLEQALAEPRPVEERLRLLEEAALLANTSIGPEGEAMARALAAQYERLGLLLVREGERRPYSVVARALMSAPLLTDAALPVVPESLVRHELLELGSGHEWDSAAALGARLDYWSRPKGGQRPGPASEAVRLLGQWARGSAFRHVADRGGESTLLPSEWRHPLVESLSKEGYNILAEFNAALEGEAYADACQIISSADPHGALGLLPDGQDPALLVSLPGAVSLAIREHPRLREVMNEQFGPRGKLRVRQAIAEEDLLAVEAATTQFSGTEAAALAHQWLGDRALGSGDFARAMGQYQQALAAGMPAAEAGPRLRLAAAMLGRSMGEPAGQPVSFGDFELTAAEFEELVAEMRESRESQARSLGWTSASADATGAAPPPASYSARRWAEVSGEAGNNPGQLPHGGQDWAGRQLATAVGEDLLLVGNRFQLAAYELGSGSLKWRSEVGSERGHTHAWPLVPMRPTIAGERVFARRLTQHGPELACFELTTGKLLWRLRPGDHVASDPLRVQDQLFVIVAAPLQPPVVQLSLATIDPETGAVVAQRPLVQLRDAWARQIPCQATVIVDKIVVAVGGSVLCCDLLGQVQWLRRQTWLPRELDPRWADHFHAPPLAANGLVFVTQPGVRLVECLEVATGRLRWRQVLSEVCRIVGVAGPRLIVETADGLAAFESGSGRPHWHHHVPHLLLASGCSSPAGLVYAFPEQITPEQQRPVLVWLDPATGAETARSPLDDLKDKQPMLGPLVVHQERIWTFFGRGEREPNREIHELLPQGPPLPATALLSRAD